MFEKRGPPRNRVLLALAPAELRRICPLLERAELLPEASPDRALAEGLWFPEIGLVSLRVRDGASLATEVALIGGESVAGTPCGGLERCGLVPLARGVAHVVAPENTARALDLAPGLAPALERATARLLDQMADTAHANARGRVVERLARWLLLAHDRLEGDALFLTHETLARMLGVRRVGITNALHVLEGRRQLRAGRGRIRILDRQGLAESAAGFYRPPPPETLPEWAVRP